MGERVKLKKKQIMLLGLFLLSLAGISFYGGAVSYGLFFGILLIPVISGSYLLYVYIRFLLYQEVGARHVVCGQPVPYYFVLQNDDFVAYTSVSVRMFPDFSYVEKVPDGREYALLPKDKYKYETRLTCKYRGEYEVGIKEIILTDFFGLFRLTYKVPSAVKAVVAPRIVSVTELRSIPEISAFLQSRSAEDIEPEGSVRDYVQGDSLKKIHWKASAKEQKLKVRQMTGEEKQGITVLCDTKRETQVMKEYLPIENKVLEILIAISLFFVNHNIKIRTVYSQNGIRHFVLNGMRDFELFYKEASGISFQKENEYRLLLEETMKTRLVLGSKAVFMIMTGIDERIMEQAAILEDSGIIVVMFVITNKDISEFIKRSSVRRKIIAVPPESRTEEVL